MFLVEAFKAQQKQPLTLRLINVDMTPERCFAELCLDRAMTYC